MITKTIKGNLLDAFDHCDVDVIAHQCNCFCNMGSGIAPQIAKRYPGAQAVDSATIKGDSDKLGTFTRAVIPRTVYGYGIKEGIVYNLYGQYGYGGNGVNTKYECLKQAMQKMQQQLKDESNEGIIGLPLIGCGLGGGDWEVVSEIINEAFTNEVHIYVL
jgi:O-acetyl-ADP-ribose deacetylase (regulator of RNase III)